MKKLVFTAVLMLAASGCWAEQKYNSFSDKWETVPDGSDWNMKYNSMEGDWSYQPEDAQTEYNSFEDKWEWDSGHNPSGGEDCD
ncbi:hypothetical protein ACFLQ8_03905 [Candidatus Auribacterota bacterium]